MTVAQEIPLFTAQQLAEAFARNVRVIKMQVNGLTHADSLLQPPVRGNCLNWVLGHIAMHRDLILEALGEEKILSQAAAARYGSGSEPILGEGEGILPLETLLAALDQGQERIAAVLRQGDAETLAREIPFGERSVTAAQHAFFLYFHDTYHVGQAEFLRQLAGKDDKVI
jgi:uncharacterized damage-inducible protein DinB